MHYFLDGYNMLFRLQGGEDLQSQREALIYHLNQKVSLLKLDVSIVFDSTFQAGERSCSHYDALEILFSAEGETADEYILDELKNCSYPQQKTVVTSDKKLAWQARHRCACTKSVEDFTAWLHRAYKNKLQQQKKDEPQPIFTPMPPMTLTPLSIPTDGARLEAYSHYYEQIFESRWQEILKKEEEPKQAPSKRPKQRQRPFQFEEPATNEMERWLKAFEKRSLELEMDFFPKD